MTTRMDNPFKQRKCRKSRNKQNQAIEDALAFLLVAKQAKSTPVFVRYWHNHTVPLTWLSFNTEFAHSHHWLLGAFENFEMRISFSETATDRPHIV